MGEQQRFFQHTRTNDLHAILELYGASKLTRCTFILFRLNEILLLHVFRLNEITFRSFRNNISFFSK